MMNEELPAEAQNKIVVFGAKRIRRTWHEEQWFFSVVDIIGGPDRQRQSAKLLEYDESTRAETERISSCPHFVYN